MRSLVSLSLAAALALPAAAPAAPGLPGLPGPPSPPAGPPGAPPPTLFKVSAYGVQRHAVHASNDWGEEGCRGEHGSYSYSAVTRFKTPKTTRMRLVRYGSVSALQPAATKRWSISGTVSAREQREGEKASCSDVNADGSIKWVRQDPVDTTCRRARVEQQAFVKLEGRKLSFGAADLHLPPLVPTSDPCQSTFTKFDLFTATAKISLEQIVEADGEPIVLRHRDDRGSANDIGGSQTSERLTAYVTFTPVKPR